MIEAKIEMGIMKNIKKHPDRYTEEQIEKKLESEFPKILGLSNENSYVQALSTSTRSAQSISQHAQLLNLPEQIQNKIVRKPELL